MVEATENENSSRVAVNHEARTSGESMKKNEDICHIDESSNDKNIMTNDVHNENNNKPPSPDKTKMNHPATIRVQCKQCNQIDCIDVCKDGTHLIAPVQSTNSSLSQNPLARISSDRTDGPPIKNLTSVNHWPTTSDEYPLSLQRESMHIDKSHYEHGSKFKIVTIINDSICLMNVDSGSFISCLSEEKAREIGLSVFPVKEIKARAASGIMRITKGAFADVDMGILVI